MGSIIVIVAVVYFIILLLFVQGVNKTTIDYEDDIKEQEKFIREYNERKKERNKVLNEKK